MDDDPRSNVVGKRLTEQQIGDMLAAHAKWLRVETGGECADLSRAVLRGADLSGADLRGADLSRADLSGADLRGAVLRGAVLRGADLSDADLRGAVLRGAVLRGAVLRGAVLSRAVLSGADLSGIKGGELALASTEIVPREGEVIGWKKCRSNVLVKVRVPPTAKRSNATGRKCRAECVETLEVVGADVGVSLHDGKTEYRVGATTTANGWGADRMVECDKGIHFWLTKEEAAAWTG